MTEREIGARMRKRRLELGMTLQDVADRVRVTRSTIQRYEAGSIRQMKLPVVYVIARALDVNPEWLIGKSDVMTITHPFNIIPMPDMKQIPLVGDIACGKPILAEENIEGNVDLPNHIHADFALTCKGDSMEGAGIYDGDIVYIRQQPEVHDGQIAAVLIDDSATLKHVYVQNDAIVLQPANPAYAPIIISKKEADTIRIIGRAVAFTHSLLGR